MSLSNYSEIEVIFESNNTLLKQGMLNNELYILKSYKSTFSESYRKQKIDKENEIHNKLSPGQSEVIYDLGNPTLIRPFFEGYPLSKFLKFWDFELETFLNISIGIAEELSKIHQHKIVHLDLNPSNIIYDTVAKKCHIIDYGSAQYLSNKSIYLGNPERIECDLNFISPEQTGRINRVVDFRSDLYSLGVVMFLMATENLLFNTENPLELVHCHIAKNVAIPSSYNSKIPEHVDKIILKLLAKNSEDRYKSDAGLIHDLKECLRLVKNNKIDTFEPGLNDKSDHFRISQKTYGRDREISIIKKAFDRTQKGQKELVLIEGSAGTGKSNLVAENHRLLVEKEAIFIEGKFDQVNRNIPFSAWVQAFNNFVELLLTQNKKNHDDWCELIKEKVGENIHYLSQIFPNIKWIFDDIKEEEMAFTPETQNRFRIAVEGFIQAITEKTPLVIFLDDWQWSDLGSVELLKFILDSDTIHNVLIIAAYRDNEISASHYFNNIRKYLDKQNELNYQVIKIGKLSPINTLSLLKDTLLVDNDKISELNKLVYDRTEGNALFYVQYLQTIADEALLRYNAEKHIWEWDIEEIKRAVISEDIVSLLLKKFLRFDAKEQEVLKKAACIGNRFSMPLLITLCDLTERQLLGLLQKPIDEGMVLKESTLSLIGQDERRQTLNFKFTHDRIQQGIYNSIPDDEKLNIHYAIGKYLLSKLNKEEQNKNLFSLVSHLNTSSKLITHEDEKNETALINLEASNKAKILYDLSNALKYANIGLEQLQEIDNDTVRKTKMSLSLNRYELAYYLYLEDKLNEWEKGIYDLKPDKLDLIRFHNIKLRGLIAKGEFVNAINEGLDILRSHGYNIKGKPNKLDIIFSFIKTSRSYKKDKISELINLPVMKDPFLIEISNTFLTINVACYFSNKNLWAIIISETTRLFIKHGITPLASITFGSFASILIIANNDIKSGVAFGKVSLEIPKKLSTSAYLNQTLFIYHALINWWEKPLEDAVDGLNEAMHLSRSVGDLQFVGHSAALRSSYKFETGCKLSELKESIFEAEKFTRESQEMVDLYLVKVYGSRTLSLHDERLPENGFNTSNYDYEKARKTHLSNNQVDVISSFHLNKGIVAYYSRKYEEAYDNVLEEEKIGGQTSFGTYNYFSFKFFKAMIKSKYITLKNPPNKTTLKKFIVKLAKDFKTFAKYAPQNFEAKYLLLKAEIATLDNKVDQALDWHHKAIESSLKYSLLQEEVLAWELAADLLLIKDQKELFNVYIKNAYVGYRKWEAWGICSRLEASFPWLKKVKIASENEILLSQSSTSSLSNLDLATVVKATEAISLEIDKERLLRKLVLISVESAGAENGFLVLNDKNTLTVSAYGNVEHETEVYENKPLSDFRTISSKVINYVVRTEKPFIIQDAHNDPLFIDDRYIQENHSRSIFCLPIINQTNMIGMLYLTNDLTIDAFSKERVELLNLLSGQIAISLENSSLVENLEEKVKTRTLEINKEKETSENLLLNILPKMTATELKLTGKAEPRYYSEVSVMFIDFVNFSGISGEIDYRELVKLLSEYFQAFDEIISQFEIEKIKTIGDAYLCASGLPLESKNHAEEIVKAALKIQSFLNDLKEEKESQGKTYFTARIGIHSGPVVAGVVGSKKFAYDIWGNTVNIAARVETSCDPGEINISSRTNELIKDQFTTEYRGKFAAKNVGDLDIYYVRS